MSNPVAMSMSMDVSPPTVAYHPHTALIFHARSGYSFSGDADVVVTRHQVRSSDNSLSPGSLISTEVAEELLRWLAGYNTRRHLLPAHVLFLCSDETVWWRASTQRPMWFQRGKRRVRLDVRWPALVFQAHDGQLRVGALATNRRPDADTNVYHAPLMNIYASGALCLGNISPPGGCGITEIPNWEAAVYDTVFTHTNHNQTLRHAGMVRDDNVAHFRFWRDIAQRVPRRFPTKALVPTEKKLEEWLWTT